MKIFSIRQIILISLMIVCLLGASSILPLVDQTRNQLGAYTIVSEEAAPPEIVLLTHLLGGFKSLLVDAVWLRAAKLQQDEQFWELNQLYDWMGKLEPHVEEIWVHNGWNMAYNLTAELDDSEARWVWVQRAIEWLRDQGLKYNPKSAKIMKEIAWIYFNKIGRNQDLHHAYYKHRFASEMHMVVGPRDLQDILELEKAPRTLSELLADPDVAKGLAGFKLDPPEEIVKTLDTVPSPLMIAAPIMRSIRKNGNVACRKKIRHYISAKLLRDKYKISRMDVIAGMETEYGKFDWRLPEPYAVYWAYLASAVDPNPNNQIDYDRIMLFSLQETMRRGQVAYIDPDPTVPLVTTFDLSKVEAVDAAYERLLRKYPDRWEDKGGGSVRDGHLQFLQESTYQLYFAGYEKRALKMHQRLKDVYDKPNPYMAMEPFVLGQVANQVNECGTEAKVRGNLVDPLIYQTCFALCTNKPDQARKCENLAKRAWAAYVEYDEANAQGRVRHSSKIPTFKAIERDMIRAILLERTAFPKKLIPVLRRILKIPVGWEKEQGRLDITGDLAPRLEQMEADVDL